jgi:hypothetical protein
MDLGTGLTVLGSAPLVQKILGPTADYLGAGLKDWTERGAKNVNRVFEKATHRLGDKINTPGAVPPKVLKGILAEGQFCDDELSAEYFGGVLASSRTSVGRDDRGAAFIALIGRLSSYQIRSHYFFYSMIRLLYEGSTETISMPEGRQNLKTFIPLVAYATAMEFSGGENAELITSHVMFGLSREDLIEGMFMFGSPGTLRSSYPQADTNGILFAPSALGAELFLWAHGRGDVRIAEFLHPDTDLRSEININTAPGSRSVLFPERNHLRPSAS